MQRKQENHYSCSHLNPKTGTYDADFIAGETNCQGRILGVNIVITNPCGESSSFETDFVREKGEPEGIKLNRISVNGTPLKTLIKESCDVNYKLKEVTSEVLSYNGSYTYMFWLSFEPGSDTPTTVTIITEITNCKNEVKYIELTLKYDAKTGMFTGAGSILQDKDCPWNMTNFSAHAVSPCGDKFNWESDEVVKRLGGRANYHMKRMKAHKTR